VLSVSFAQSGDHRFHCVLGRVTIASLHLAGELGGERTTPGRSMKSEIARYSRGLSFSSRRTSRGASAHPAGSDRPILFAIALCRTGATGHATLMVGMDETQ